KPLANLSMTLTRLRQTDETLFQSDDVRVSSTVELDVLELIRAFETEAYDDVMSLYHKPFLEGLSTKALSNELEEWVYEKREYVAGLVRDAKLHLAELAAKQAEFQTAAEQAAEAYHLRYAPEPDEQILERMFVLLQADHHRLAKEVREEALEYGLNLGMSQDEARARFEGVKQASITHNLPDYLSSFIGRQAELKILDDYVNHEDKRLISIVGLGGMGKTRLALELARHQLDKAEFVDGVYFVALDALKDSFAIPFEIADAMNLQLRGDLEPLDLLIKQLDGKTCLLILDNYEHLLEAASLCSQLLKRCTNIKLVVTSRERLNVAGEWVYPLRGLSKGQTSKARPSVSMHSTETKPEDFQDAIALFVYYAQQADLTFVLNNSNQAAISSICQVVDGSPLALQLAASWTKLLSPAEIASEIHQSFDVLSSRSTQVDEKHQSIEAVFEYSWQRLTDKERAVLRKLSVFEGGFTRDAANNIAAANLAILATLTDKSLIRTAGENRFDLHPLIKQFAAFRLAAREEEQRQTQEKHALFFELMIGNPQTFHDSAIQEGLTGDYENALASWRWLILNKGEQDISNFANGMFMLIFMRTRFLEGVAIFKDAEEYLRDIQHVHVPSLALIVRCKSWSLMEQGLFSSAFEGIQNTINLLASEPPHFAHWAAFHASCNFSRKVGLFKEGKANALQAIEMADSLGLEQQKTLSEGELGAVLSALGDYQSAQEIFLKAYVQRKQQGMLFQAFQNLMHQGELHLAIGNFVEARECLETSLEWLEGLGTTAALMRCLDSNARLELAERNTDKSLQLVNRAIEMSRLLGAKYYEARALVTLGRIHLAKDELDVSYKHLTDAVRLAHSQMAYSTQLTALAFLAELNLKQEHYETAYGLLNLVLRHESAEFWVKEKATELMANVEKHQDENVNKIISAKLTLEQAVAELI
ncbi:MAG: NB-ARC domain-containing protein, partial [Deinococcota bacterium]